LERDCKKPATKDEPPTLHENRKRYKNIKEKYYYILINFAAML
jgi:hypothetical protein